MSADNQQERLDTKWIVGFVDGEGCFHVAINQIKGMKLGWQVLPEFRIVQHSKDQEVLEKIKDYFGFGIVTVNRKDKHGVRKEFRVRGLENLNKLVKFFMKNELQTTKKKNFELFAEIISKMNRKEHLNKKGLDKIANLITKMNRNPKIKYLESSETTRQTQ